MNKLTVEVHRLKNIYDKDQLYLILREGDTLSGTKVIINVGEKTWNAVSKLLNMKLPIEEIKNKKETIK